MGASVREQRTLAWSAYCAENVRDLHPAGLGVLIQVDMPLLAKATHRPKLSLAEHVLGSTGRPLLPEIAGSKRGCHWHSCSCELFALSSMLPCVSAHTAKSLAAQPNGAPVAVRESARTGLQEPLCLGALDLEYSQKDETQQQHSVVRITSVTVAVTEVTAAVSLSIASMLSGCVPTQQLAGNRKVTEETQTADQMLSKNIGYCRKMCKQAF